MRQTERMFWRRIDRPGHEVVELRQQPDGWRLHGIAVFADGTQYSALEYDIICDARWRTTSTTVTSLLGVDSRTVELVRLPTGDWLVDGAPRADLRGCYDVDLGFSPSTNLLPIRRLSLNVGDEAAIRAAWVRFPELTIEVLEQAYRRMADSIYHYESAGGTFFRDLVVNRVGFVLEYPGIWTAEMSPDEAAD